jgi:hypothetical protein
VQLCMLTYLMHICTNIYLCINKVSDRNNTRDRKEKVGSFSYYHVLTLPVKWYYVIWQRNWIIVVYCKHEDSHRKSKNKSTPNKKINRYTKNERKWNPIKCSIKITKGSEWKIKLGTKNKGSKHMTVINIININPTLGNHIACQWSKCTNL